jgi:hypothetical protein
MQGLIQKGKMFGTQGLEGMAESAASRAAAGSVLLLRMPSGLQTSTEKSAVWSSKECNPLRYEAR